MTAVRLLLLSGYIVTVVGLLVVILRALPGADEAGRRLSPRAVPMAALMLVTGLAFVVVNLADGASYGWAAVKALLLSAVVVLVWANRRRAGVPLGVLGIIGGLTLLTAIAPA